VCETRRREPAQSQGDQYFVSHSFYPQKLEGTRFRRPSQVPKVTRQGTRQLLWAAQQILAATVVRRPPITAGPARLASAGGKLFSPLFSSTWPGPTPLVRRAWHAAGTTDLASHGSKIFKPTQQLTF